MQDFLRERLNADELERYETYDALAVIATQFLVWPALLALICYATSQTTIATVCGTIAAIALPCMLFTGQKARAILKIAETRYLSIMGGGYHYDR